MCETCQGSGKIDERLGGYSFSNPSATCPDCDGLGEIEPIHDSRVTAQAEGYVTALRYIAWEAAGYMDCVHAAKRAIGEMGALPPPPKIQPTEAGG